MSGHAYSGTSVPVEKSQAEIRASLRAYGADHFAFSESPGYAEVGFTHAGLAVRMRVAITPMPADEAAALARKRRVSAASLMTLELAERRVWRILYWLLKTRMEAIDAGVETFAEAFLAHIVHPDSGHTVYETMVGSGAMRQLGAGS